MDAKPAFRRVLLKLSGEVLSAGEAVGGIDVAATAAAAAQVSDVIQRGVQVALVIGGGNFFRGLPASARGISRTTADYIGMLATVMNALAMRDALAEAGIKALVQSSIPVPGAATGFNLAEAKAFLDNGGCVIFGGGTGHPFLSTDTTAALRACEIGADAVIKGTKVDGIYSADPKREPRAVKFPRLTFDQAIEKRLQVMDQTAFTLCRENRMPIVVLDFFATGSLARVAGGDLDGATLVSY